MFPNQRTTAGEGEEIRTQRNRLALLDDQAHGAKLPVPGQAGKVVVRVGQNHEAVGDDVRSL